VRRIAEQLSTTKEKEHMAQIPQSSGGTSDFGPPPPAGTYLAVCTEVIDLYGVKRKKYESEEMEDVNVTRFVFGVKTKSGALHLIATREMKISGSPKSNMMKTIKAWTGEMPKPGWDTAELKGKGAQITVTAEEARNGKVYNNITGIAPVLDGYEAKVPKVAAFANVGGPSDDSDLEVLGPVKDESDPF
jgi:hypothetical protein